VSCVDTGIFPQFDDSVDVNKILMGCGLAFLTVGRPFKTLRGWEIDER